MKITVARCNEDRYIIIETEERTVTFKAEMLMKSSEVTHTKTEDYAYESEVFEATFLREEPNKMTNDEKERILGALNYKDKNGKERTLMQVRSIEWKIQ